MPKKDSLVLFTLSPSNKVAFFFYLKSTWNKDNPATGDHKKTSYLHTEQAHSNETAVENESLLCEKYDKLKHTKKSSSRSEQHELKIPLLHVIYKFKGLFRLRLDCDQTTLDTFFSAYD